MSAESISIAIRILCDSPDLSDEYVFEELVKAGVERVYAARLIEFIPSVYCRLLLSQSGVRFSGKFLRESNSHGGSPEHLLASDPVWLEIAGYAARHPPPGQNELLRIVARSAEFGVINQMLNKGSRMQDLILSPLVLKWPETGPA